MKNKTKVDLIEHLKIYDILEECGCDFHTVMGEDTVKHLIETIL